VRLYKFSFGINEPISVRLVDLGSAHRTVFHTLLTHRRPACAARYEMRAAPQQHIWRSIETVGTQRDVVGLFVGAVLLARALHVVDQLLLHFRVGCGLGGDEQCESHEQRCRLLLLAENQAL
jgi:hypothetical protein